MNRLNHIVSGIVYALVRGGSWSKYQLDETLRRAQATRRSPAISRQIVYVVYRNRYVILFSILYLYLLFLSVRLATRFLPSFTGTLTFLVALKLGWLIGALNKSLFQYIRMKSGQSAAFETERRQKQDILLFYTTFIFLNTLILTPILGLTAYAIREQTQAFFLFFLIASHTTSASLQGIGMVRQALALGRGRIFHTFWTIYSPMLVQAASLIIGIICFGPWGFVAAPPVAALLNVWISFQVTQVHLPERIHPYFIAQLTRLRSWNIKTIAQAASRFFGTLQAIPYDQLKRFVIPRMGFSAIQYGATLTVFAILLATHPAWAYAFSIFVICERALGKLGSRFGKSIHYDIQRALTYQNVVTATRFIRLVVIAAPLAGLFILLLGSLSKSIGLFNWLAILPKLYMSERTVWMILCLSAVTVMRRCIDSLWPIYPYMARANSRIGLLYSLGIGFQFGNAMLSSGSLESVFFGWALVEGCISILTAVMFWSSKHWLEASPYTRRYFEFSPSRIEEFEMLRDNSHGGVESVPTRFIRQLPELLAALDETRTIARCDHTLAQVGILLKWRPHAAHTFLRSTGFRVFLSKLRRTDIVFEFPTRDLLIIARGVEKQKTTGFLHRFVPALASYCDVLDSHLIPAHSSGVRALFETIFTKHPPTGFFYRDAAYDPDYDSHAYFSQTSDASSRQLLRELEEHAALRLPLSDLPSHLRQQLSLGLNSLGYFANRRLLEGRYLPIFRSDRLESVWQLPNQAFADRTLRTHFYALSLRVHLLDQLDRFEALKADRLYQQMVSHEEFQTVKRMAETLASRSDLVFVEMSMRRSQLRRLREAARARDFLQDSHVYAARQGWLRYAVGVYLPHHVLQSENWKNLLIFCGIHVSHKLKARSSHGRRP